MCLTTPMRVLSVERGHAVCEAEGARRSVSLYLLQHESIRPGTWLAVDRGFALEVLSEQRAAEAWAVMKAMPAGPVGAARLAESAFLPSRDLVAG